MRHLLRRYRSLLVVAALLVLPLFFLYGGASGRESSGLLTRMVQWVTGPVQAAVTGGTRAVARAGDAYLWLIDAADENRRLRQELHALRAERTALQEVAHENQRLRRLLDLERGLPHTRSVVARVIGFGQSPSYRTLRIDRGTRDGVQRRAGVITADGAVGRVVVASHGYADVLLLTDAGMRLDVIAQRSRAHGVLRGASTVCHLDAMDRTLDLAVGDVLVTSGLDGSFPKGVPVGTVREVSRPRMGLYLEAAVEPLVELSRLEEVAVLIESPAELGWPALGGGVVDRPRALEPGDPGAGPASAPADAAPPSPPRPALVPRPAPAAAAATPAPAAASPARDAGAVRVDAGSPAPLAPPVEATPTAVPRRDAGRSEDRR
jgi:rod shape-determining protein MreC